MSDTDTWMANGYLDLGEMKNQLALLTAKHWAGEGVVRILDQHEVLGKAPGTACTLQLADYGSNNWLPCDAGGKPMRSLTAWYKLLRGELAWDERIVLAVATKD